MTEYCPYCNIKDPIFDIWENEDGDRAKCYECGGIISISVRVSYSLDKADLSNDPNHQHEYEEWRQHNVDQNQLDYRKKTPGLMQTLDEDTPHTYYSRDCKLCGHTELSERVELYAPNPRLLGQNHD